MTSFAALSVAAMSMAHLAFAIRFKTPEGGNIVTAPHGDNLARPALNTVSQLSGSLHLNDFKDPTSSTQLPAELNPSRPLNIGGWSHLFFPSRLSVDTEGAKGKEEAEAVEEGTQQQGLLRGKSPPACAVRMPEGKQPMQIPVVRFLSMGYGGHRYKAPLQNALFGMHRAIGEANTVLNQEGSSAGVYAFVDYLYGMATWRSEADVALAKAEAWRLKAQVALAQSEAVFKAIDEAMLKGGVESKKGLKGVRSDVQAVVSALTSKD